MSLTEVQLGVDRRLMLGCIDTQSSMVEKGRTEAVPHLAHVRVLSAGANQEEYPGVSESG